MNDAIPCCVNYVPDTDIECNTPTLNFTTADVRSRSRRTERASALIVVGLWVQGPAETFRSRCLRQWSISDLFYRQRKVDVPQPVTPESDFTDSTGALEEMNSFVAHWLAFVLSSTLPPPHHPINQTSPKPFWLKFKSICSLSASPRRYGCWGRPASAALRPYLLHPYQQLSSGLPPTLAYKTQVCKHKSLPRAHKRQQIRREQSRNKEQGDWASWIHGGALICPETWPSLDEKH